VNRLVDKFLDKWPDAEYGPGHIVLSDDNVENACIDWCLSLLDSLLDRTPWPETQLDRHIYDDCDREELAATREFLKAFRSVPEAHR